MKTVIRGRDDFLKERREFYNCLPKNTKLQKVSYAIEASACTFRGQVTLTSVRLLMALILLARSRHVRRRHKTRNSTTETNVNTMECKEKFSEFGEPFAGTEARSSEGNI